MIVWRLVAFLAGALPWIAAFMLRGGDDEIGIKGVVLAMFWGAIVGGFAAARLGRDGAVWALSSFFAADLPFLILAFRRPLPPKVTAPVGHRHHFDNRLIGAAVACGVCRTPITDALGAWCVECGMSAHVWCVKDAYGQEK